jgi:hypothetical protein
MWKGKAHFTVHIFQSDSLPRSAYEDVNEQRKEMKVYNSCMDSNFIHTCTVVAEAKRYYYINLWSVCRKMKAEEIVQN